MFLWREKERGGDDQDTDGEVINLKLAKHRNGPTGEIQLWFKKRQTRFVSLRGGAVRRGQLGRSSAGPVAGRRPASGRSGALRLALPPPGRRPAPPAGQGRYHPTSSCDDACVRRSHLAISAARWSRRWSSPCVVAVACTVPMGSGSRPLRSPASASSAGHVGVRRLGCGAAASAAAQLALDHADGDLGAPARSSATSRRFEATADASSPDSPSNTMGGLGVIDPAWATGAPCAALLFPPLSEPAPSETPRASARGRHPLGCHGLTGRELPPRLGPIAMDACHPGACSPSRAMIRRVAGGAAGRSFGSLPRGRSFCGPALGAASRWMARRRIGG